MSVPAVLPLLADEAPCWHAIGVLGDRSCPELPAVIHCRNCPTFRSAAESLLTRPAPAGYLTEWTQRLAVDRPVSRRRLASALFFRLGSEWMAIETRLLAEVVEPRPVHRVPHCGRGALRGLVNVRGSLELCVSLHEVLGVPVGQQQAQDRPRLLVAHDGATSWVFAADEVHGVEQLDEETLDPMPATVSRGDHHGRGVLRWGERRVCFLDGERLFRSLEASLS